MRLFRSVQWRLVIILILLILLAMEFVGVYLLNSLERYYVNAVSGSVAGQAQLLAGFLQRYFTTEPDKDYATRMARQFAQQSSVVVLNATGGLVATSVDDANLLARFLIQAEVVRALTGARIQIIRLDPETGERNLHVITPIMSNQQVLGLVYMISSIEETYRTLGDIRTILFTATALSILVTAVVGWTLARTITKPIEEVTRGAERMASGDFDSVIRVRGRDEIGQLAEMFNFLANRLRATLSQMEGERTKLEAVLNSMTDGVVAIDQSNAIELVNPTAARFLGQTAGGLMGIQASKALSPVLSADEVNSATGGKLVSVRKPVANSPSKTVLQVVSAPTGHGADRGGTVLVLQDVTAQDRLDAMRKEFVANVSHELKTPITTVKSYVETLLDGALEDPITARQFLEVVLKESDRMNRLVRDLLDLSRLDYQQVKWDLRPAKPLDLLNDTAQKLHVRAEQKNISIAVEAGDVPMIMADWDRLQQVVINVLANAVEYTPAGGRVGLSAVQVGPCVRFSVRDTGPGIPVQDLPRIFERFYRVDKGRSRQSGGTGLGLSIAKEIVEAHGGTIWIESEQGHGTSVIFDIPIAGEAVDDYE